jgi:hemoglobin-like flavoprotein
LEPRTKDVFGFSRDYAPSAKELKKSGNLIHAIRMIHMFDGAFNMLGPDTETLNSILVDLGKRHIKYKVKVHYYPFMGKALIYALHQVIPDLMTPEVEEAWRTVYDELSGTIMQSILNHS